MTTPGHRSRAVALLVGCTALLLIVLATRPEDDAAAGPPSTLDERTA